MERRTRSTWWLAVAGTVAALAAACGPQPDPGGPPVDPAAPITRGDGNVAGNGSARGASTSADGVWTAFSSSASNLVAGDTNGLDDVFLRNNTSGSVTRIATAATAAPTISRDGRYVGFASSTTYGVHDRLAGSASTWTDVSQLNAPAVTDSGQYAVNGAGSSFGLFAVHCRIRDLVAGTTTDCPKGPADYGTVALAGLSGNAHHVLYYWHDQSGGTTSTYYLYDVLTGVRTTLGATFLGLGISNVVSDDGSTILGAGFGSSSPAVIHDVASDTSVPFPGSPDGTVMPIGFSPDGRYAAVVSDATNLVPTDTNAAADVFVLDRNDSGLSLVSTAFGTGAQLTYGATFCAKATGQVLNSGRVCVLAQDEMSPAVDTNVFADAFLTSPQP